MRFDKKLTTYNGQIICCKLITGLYGFGADNIRKTVRTIWLSIKPHSRTSALVNYISDRDVGEESIEIMHSTFSYRNMSYSNMTYNTNHNPKPFKIKLQAKNLRF